MEQSRKRRAWKTIGLALGILGLVLTIIFLIRPPCLILSATGLTCPGCGAQRMVRALFHGDAVAAFHYNPFLFTVTPFLLSYAVWEAVRYARGKPALARRRGVQIALGAVVAAAVVFMALRNLPGFEFLGP